MRITYIRSNEKCVSIKQMGVGLFYRNITEGLDYVYYIDSSYGLVRLDLMTLHSLYIYGRDVNHACYYPVVVTADITVKDL